MCAWKTIEKHCFILHVLSKQQAYLPPHLYHSILWDHRSGQVFAFRSFEILDPGHVFVVGSGGITDPVMRFAMSSSGITYLAWSSAEGSRGITDPFLGSTSMPDRQHLTTDFIFPRVSFTLFWKCCQTQKRCVLSKVAKNHYFLDRSPPRVRTERACPRSPSPSSPITLSLFQQCFLIIIYS